MLDTLESELKANGDHAYLFGWLWCCWPCPMLLTWRLFGNDRLAWRFNSLLADVKKFINARMRISRACLQHALDARQRNVGEHLLQVGQAPLRLFPASNRIQHFSSN